MDNVRQIIYIIDDDASFRTGITRLLRAIGYTVESFSSASAFLEQLHAGLSGCVIVDLQMPGMDGIALQREISTSVSALPVIFLTAHGDIPTTVEAMRMGAEDFLQKTVDHDILISAIERALQRDIKLRNSRQRHQELLSLFGSLTSREHQVLLQVIEGLLNKQIADNLKITERSVKRHRTNLMAKIQVRSVVKLAQLVEEARTYNIL